MSISRISTVAAQSPITGIGNFSHIVANMNRAIEFYRDVIGLEILAAPQPR